MLFIDTGPRVLLKEEAYASNPLNGYFVRKQKTNLCIFTAHPKNKNVG